MPESALVNVADYERRASEMIDAGALGYFAGGAGDERTLRRNVAAYAEWELIPRVLVDVSDVDSSVELFGSRLSMPLAVAPVAFQRLVNEGGEEAMARAAGAADTAMCLSTIATATPGSVAAAAPEATKWFQLYVFRDRAVTEALLAEAVESGYEAIFLTVDAPFAGRRERDLRAGFEVDVGTPSVQAAIGSDRPVTVKEVFGLVDASLDWDDLASLAENCELPVVVKGLVHPADAELAIEAGAGGIVVSNHGGRQLDGVPATIDALPAVADSVVGRVPLLVDGGIRRGTDLLVALALGADAVLAGRPALWGLAVNGEQGVRDVLEIFKAEIRLALALLGCRTPADVSRAHVARGLRG
ncbi:MAG: alpha-hydroxy-acid oxidizing protein [Actinomycetota bacterium]|nr:alpha-hydroxy-acid oxidizing protein [Actinomycetota bacterium]